MSNQISLDSQLDDDAPLAGPAASVAGKKKAGGLPPWVFLFIAGLVIVVVVAVLALNFIGKKRQAQEQEVVTESVQTDSAAPVSGVVQSQSSNQAQPVSDSARPYQASPLSAPYQGQGGGLSQEAAPVPVASDAPVAASDPALVARVAELESRVEQLTAIISGQPASMRRVISQRAASSLRQRVPKSAARQAKVVPIEVRGDFTVHAVVGNRAWLRSAGADDASVVVAPGDVVNGISVREVSSLKSSVLMADGTAIH